QELIDLLGRSRAADRPPLVAQPRPERIPLSYAQQRLWFLYRMEGPSAVYNVPTAPRLDGAIDAEALEAALSDVAARHESLRTVFPEDGGRAYQWILPVDRIRLPFLREDVAESELTARLAAASSTPFNLTEEIPLRAWLFRLTATEHVLLLLVHHI